MSEPEKLKVESYSADPVSTRTIKEYANRYGRSVSEMTRLAIKLGLEQVEKSLPGELLILPEDDHRTSLGRFHVTGDPAQVQRCTGTCGEVLHYKSFPTPRGGAASGLRVTECRNCRDRRLGRK